MYTSWNEIVSFLLKLYKIELSDVVIKKIFLMFVNIGLLGGLGFLKQFQQGSLYSGLAVMILNNIGALGKGELLTIETIGINMISLAGILIGSGLI